MIDYYVRNPWLVKSVHMPARVYTKCVHVVHTCYVVMLCYVCFWQNLLIYFHYKKTITWQNNQILLEEKFQGPFFTFSAKTQYCLIISYTQLSRLVANWNEELKIINCRDRVKLRTILQSAIPSIQRLLLYLNTTDLNGRTTIIFN